MALISGGKDVTRSQVRPFVSVVTAVFQGRKTLESTIESVLNQNHHNFEFIVVDGGSTDGTVDLLKHWSSKIDYWISEPDAGVYDAWNKALAIARGDWVSFLGSGDEYLPDAISSYSQYIADSDRELEYVSSNVELVSADGPVEIIGEAWEWSRFRKWMTVAHVGSLHSRRLFDKIGGFETSFRIAGDYEFLLRGGPTLKAGHLDKVTAKMRIGGLSDSTDSLHESFVAKTSTGARTVISAHLDRYLATAKYKFRRLIF